MALLSGQQVCDEVAFRIMNRLPANGTGAGSIIDNANRALGLISSAASWVWDQTSVAVTLTVDSGVLALGDMGKEMAFFNLPNGTRIERSKTSDYLSDSAGYINTSGTLYNTYRLAADAGGGTYAPYVYFFPAFGNTGNTFVTGVYHLIPPVLVYGASPTVRWTVLAMDQLLIDLTEASVKRYLGLAGWDTLWGDCIKRISEFKVTYSSQRQNTGPDDESQVNIEEKQAGRD